ncbi:MAG: hypothetical protein IJ341_02550 [Bacteroidales bacterium]|nr:hypothetical protein [Bacteroidales bacterium]
MYREIEETLYMVNFYGCANQHFVEAKTIEDLFEYVAKRTLKGDIFFSAKEICKDGSTPKVKVLTDKRYKEILKRLSASK